MKIKSIPVQFKAGPDDGLAEGEFIVYPSTFTRDPDSYGDVVAKGAFLDDIKERASSGFVLPGLYGHRMDDPDFFIASALEESEDDHGWRIKGAFDLESPKGKQVYRLVKGKRLNQLSFAYDTLDEGQVVLDTGEKANELRKLHVHEFSFVPVGANQDTSVVAVKEAADRLTADVKADRLTAKNETTLREAQTSLEDAAAQIKSVLSAIDATGENDGKAKASEPANDEDLTAATPEGKSEEPMRPTPADLSALQCIELAAISGE